MAGQAPGKSHRKGITLVELFQMFPDDAAAEAWFRQMRWPDGLRCAYCGSENIQDDCKHKTMPFRCRENTCGKKFSTRTGTVLQSSKLGYQKWALAIYILNTNIKGAVDEAPQGPRHHAEVGLASRTPNPRGLERGPGAVSLAQLRRTRRLWADSKRTATPRRGNDQAAVQPARRQWWV